MKLRYTFWQASLRHSLRHIFIPVLHKQTPISSNAKLPRFSSVALCWAFLSRYDWKFSKPIPPPCVRSGLNLNVFCNLQSSRTWWLESWLWCCCQHFEPMRLVTYISCFRHADRNWTPVALHTRTSRQHSLLTGFNLQSYANHSFVVSVYRSDNYSCWHSSLSSCKCFKPIVLTVWRQSVGLNYLFQPSSDCVNWNGRY